MDFDWQFDTLSYETGLSNIVSNKNHGIAWQGRLEFYYWCQNKGIQLEHSRGDRGFTFGTSHPWLPMEDDRPNGDFLDVLALPFLTQDFTVVCPHGFMRPLVDQCHATYGVAHVLYHPSHVEDPECERSIPRRRSPTPRSLGMEWWTSEEINNWERVPAAAYPSLPQAMENPPPKAPTVFNRPTASTKRLCSTCFPPTAVQHPLSRSMARTVPTRTVERYGHRFAQITADLRGEHELGITPAGA